MTAGTRTAAILMEAFREAALQGKRCPDNNDLSDLFYRAGGSRFRYALDCLVADGKIRIEICGKNWRTVYLVGENLNTALEPNGNAPWLIIDKSGRRKT